MDQWYGANKIAVGHVCQGTEMRILSTRRGDVAAGSYPLAGFSRMWIRGGCWKWSIMSSNI